MQKTLAEIADLVEGQVIGDKDLVITGVSGIREAKQGDITFVANGKYISLLKETKASAVIIPKDMEASDISVIQAENPSFAFSKVVSLVADQEPRDFEGIHPTAVVAESAEIGQNVSIGPHAIVERDAVIGDNCVIYGNSFIGFKTQIGKDSLIYPNVTIREKSQIGERVIIHSGTVIGSDGFGYEQIDGKHEKIPQIGIAEIQDDVEIGANVTIDRARFDKTIIGRGTKIDNLVQIAHNVVIGENCVIIAQVGISGSTTIGKNSILAGQAGAAGHLTIGENSVVAAQTGVTKSIPPNSKVIGFPAKDHEDFKKVNAALQRLPEHVKTIQELKKRIEELENGK